MNPPVLSPRVLNRTTLQRQLLLGRARLDPLDAVARLVGLQAQEPLDPYLGLWSRLDAFDPVSVGQLLEQRRVVRMVVMRATIHLVTVTDALSLRPLMQPVLDAELRRHPQFAPSLAGVDLDPVMAFAHEALTAEPRSTRQLRDLLAERFPDLDARALAYASRCRLPLVQVPPRGVWGKVKQVTLAPLDTWVDRPLAASPSLDDVVRRYLAAFGPATAADVAAWCGLTGMGEVLERLRPSLAVFHDERGRELFDVPDAPRADPDTPAPVRFLPQYDNALLSHAGRSRFGIDQWRFASTQGDFKGTVLVDGWVRGLWRVAVDGRRGPAVLTVEHLRLTKREHRAMVAEAERAVRFRHPDAERHEVRLTEPG